MDGTCPPRVVSCDRDELELTVSIAADLLADLILTGREWHWDNRGLVRRLPRAIRLNVLDAYMSYIRRKHPRTKIPPHASRFFWSQTVPLVSEDQANNLVDSSPAEEPTGGSKPD